MQAVNISQQVVSRFSFSDFEAKYWKRFVIRFLFFDFKAKVGWRQNTRTLSIEWMPVLLSISPPSAGSSLLWEVSTVTGKTKPLVLVVQSQTCFLCSFRTFQVNCSPVADWRQQSDSEAHREPSLRRWCHFHHISIYFKATWHFILQCLTSEVESNKAQILCNLICYSAAVTSCDCCCHVTKILSHHAASLLKLFKRWGAFIVKE